MGLEGYVELVRVLCGGYDELVVVGESSCKWVGWLVRDFLGVNKWARTLCRVGQSCAELCRTGDC